MKTQLSILTLLLYLLVSCTEKPPLYIEIAENEPQKLIAIQDSLLIAEPNNLQLRNALAQAHINVALISLNKNNDTEAITSLQKSLELDEKNQVANYYLAMIIGLRLFKKGSRSALWDAIEQFSRAARFNTTAGEPFYWIGRSYEKKSDQDFELIIESFDKALALQLTDELRNECNAHRNSVLKRKQVFDDFWK
jgi:tetratricopeptide (TPR) repeat protein